MKQESLIKIQYFTGKRRLKDFTAFLLRKKQLMVIHSYNLIEFTGEKVLGTFKLNLSSTNKISVTKLKTG